MKERYMIAGKVQERNKIALVILLTVNLSFCVYSQKTDSIAVVNSFIELVKSERASSFIGLNELNKYDSINFCYLKYRNVKNMIFIKIKIRKYDYIKERILNINGITSNDSCAKALKDINFFNDILKIKYPKFNLKLNSDLEKIVTVELRNNSIYYNCDYVLAYSINDANYFKLKGFRNTDYKEFVEYLSTHAENCLDLELRKKISLLSLRKILKTSKIISSNMFIDEVDLNKNHYALTKYFVKKTPYCSCFQKEAFNP